MMVLFVLLLVVDVAAAATAAALWVLSFCSDRPFVVALAGRLS